jgi:hypothetical protein
MLPESPCSVVCGCASLVREASIACRELFAGVCVAIYDGQGSWIPWLAADAPPPPKVSFGEMIVPTKDSLRYKFLMSLLVSVSGIENVGHRLFQEPCCVSPCGFAVLPLCSARCLSLSLVSPFYVSISQCTLCVAACWDLNMTSLQERKSVLLTGDTGTGKTVNISSMLQVRRRQSQPTCRPASHNPELCSLLLLTHVVVCRCVRRDSLSWASRSCPSPLLSPLGPQPTRPRTSSVRASHLLARAPSLSPSLPPLPFSCSLADTTSRSLHAMRFVLPDELCPCVGLRVVLQMGRWRSGSEGSTALWLALCTSCLWTTSTCLPRRSLGPSLLWSCYDRCCVLRGLPCPALSTPSHARTMQLSPPSFSTFPTVCTGRNFMSGRWMV